MEKDIRWEQRFSNYRKALAQLEKAIKLNEEGTLSELEEQGLIQSFEFTYELGWNTMKDYLEYHGSTNISGSRDTIKEAFKVGVITDGEGWMDMIESRIKTSHTYNEEIANQIAKAIIES